MHGMRAANVETVESTVHFVCRVVAAESDLVLLVVAGCLAGLFATEGAWKTECHRVPISGVAGLKLS